MTLTDTLPVALNSLCASAYNGVIYIFSGNDGSDIVNTVYAYTPGANPSAVALSAGTYSGRMYFKIVALSAQLVIIGGSNGTAVKDICSFNPGDLSMSDAPIDLSSARYAFAAVSLGSDIYLFGGKSGNQITSRYSTAIGEVQDFDMPVFLEGPAAATNGSNIFVFGGSTGLPGNAVYRFTP